MKICYSKEFTCYLVLMAAFLTNKTSSCFPTLCLMMFRLFTAVPL